MLRTSMTSNFLEINTRRLSFQWRRTLHFLQKHTFENLIFIPTYVNRTYEIQVSWRSELAQTVSKIQVQYMFLWKRQSSHQWKCTKASPCLFKKKKKKKTSLMFWVCSIVYIFCKYFPRSSADYCVYVQVSCQVAGLLLALVRSLHHTRVHIWWKIFTKMNYMCRL